MRQLLKRSCVYSRIFVCLALSMTCFYSQAQAINQHDNTVTLSGSNIPLSEIFRAIKQQTGISVMYSKAVTGLDQEDQVSVRFNKTPLDQVLAMLFKGKDLEWTYNDNVVLIRKRESPSATPVKKSVGDSSINSISVTGRVTDAGGLPLPGATIMVKGTTQGTTTDAEGNFSLPKVSSKESLIISSVGYETREIAVRGKTILAQLNVVVNDLDETVVVAYSTTTRRLSTGNVTVIKGEDIARQPVNNPLLALQGRVPGLFVTQSTGLPGSAVTVRIQGQNSILKGNDPFYVVDGVPYTSQMLPGAGSIQGTGSILNGEATYGSPLSYINPSDIESISVLKDADATAIYGSRAANGAILITTRKGKVGKTKIDLNVQSGWGKITRKLNLLNTKQYLEMRREAFKNDERVPSNDPVNPDFAPDITVWDSARNTDWQKELIGGTAKYTDLNGSISGGTAFFQYLVGGTYHRETTVLPVDFSDQKGSIHYNFNSASSDRRFRMQFSGSYLVDDNRLPAYDMTPTAIVLPPNAPSLYNMDGNLNWAEDANGYTTWIGGRHPAADLYNKFSSKTNNFVGNILLSYQVIPGLEIKSSFGYNNLHAKETLTQPLSVYAPQLRPYYTRVGIYTDNTISSWIIEPQLNYRRSMGKGILDVLIGATVQRNNSNGQSLFGGGHPSDAVIGDISAASNTAVISSTQSIYKYNAGFARLNYNWKEKYIIDLTGRRDGSSRFGPQNQFHNFGSIGAAWIFSQENFVRNNLSFLSFGKIRGSYGTTGSDQIGDYQYISRYFPFNPGVPYQGATGLLPISLTNPYLAWEETRKLQAGLEVGLFSDRILFNATYFRNRSSNQLLSYSLPVITGFRSIAKNFPATVQNSGWEFSLDLKNINNKDFSWSTSLNLTIPKNKLIEFPGLETSPYADFLMLGQSLSVIKAFHYLGVNSQTGEYQVADIHGNPTTTPDGAKDNTVILDNTPKFYGGVQNAFKYRGFELNFLFQFIKQIGANYVFGSGIPGISMTNQPTSILPRWQKPGDDVSIQRYNSTGSLYGPYFNALQSDAGFTDASFIRLKNISLSWQVPEKWRQKAHLQACRFYLQGQNLVTITGFKGMDPETRTISALPPLKVLTLGAQVTF